MGGAGLAPAYAYGVTATRGLVPGTMLRVTDDAGEAADVAARLLPEFLRRTHLSAPDDLVRIARESAATVGVRALSVFLVDYEQTHLMPLLAVDPAAEPLSIEGTLHGRVFATSSILQAAAEEEGARRLLVPLLDGTERLGTVEYLIATDGGDVPEAMVAVCERYAHLLAQTIVTKTLYGDVFELTRRTQPMDVSAELIWRVLPPLTFATDGLLISGLLEPCYHAGGDCFDYAVDSGTAHIAIFDAMGHGLPAAGVSTFAVTAYRNARRRGLDLPEVYREMDEAINEQDGDRYVTAVLAELELSSGRLLWISAGHPPPLLLREGRVVKTLEGEAATPLGIPFGSGVQVSEEWLQPGDQVLLYTDGLPEARLEDGSFFTLERLGEFLERAAASGLPAPETLRRLRHAVFQHQRGRLQDDATALLLEWRRGGERSLLPPTV